MSSAGTYVLTKFININRQVQLRNPGKFRPLQVSLIQAV